MEEADEAGDVGPFWKTVERTRDSAGREVLRLVGAGYGNNETANDLCSRIETLETRRADIMERQNLHHASALDAGAAEKGLVTK